MQIETFDSPLAASEAAQAELEKALLASQKDTTPVLLLLSGGSALDVVADLDPSLLSATTILPLDERFSSNPALNNSLQMQALGLPVTLVVPQQDETLEAFGQRFDQLLRGWRRHYPQGVIIATIGMGADGHIAGISPMPTQPKEFDSMFVTTSAWAVGYQGNLEPAERVTVTVEFLEEIDVAIGFVTGETKAEALRAAFSDQATTDFPQDISQLPAVVLPSLDGILFTTIHDISIS